MVRLVEGVRGTVTMEMHADHPLRVRPGGPVGAADGRHAQRRWPGRTRCRCGRRCRAHGSGPVDRVAEFTIGRGSAPSPSPCRGTPPTRQPPRPVDAVLRHLRTPSSGGQEWASQCTYQRRTTATRWLRSLITLKALTYEPTGGIVAAAHDVAPRDARGQPQLGLPRSAGCADATLTLESLMRGGFYAGGHGVADVAAAGRRPAIPSQIADHVRGGWVSAASTSGRSTGCPATRAPRRCGSATPPPASSSSTSYGEVMSALLSSSVQPDDPDSGPGLGVAARA